MNRVLVIGDSWASAVVAGNGGRDGEGWPLMLGIPPEMRQAIGGSTARDWAQDKDGRLTRAKNTPCEICVMSLIGNDAFHAIADGSLSYGEIREMVQALRAVVTAMMTAAKRVVVLLYADPYRGERPMEAVGCEILNSLIVMICTGLNKEGASSVTPFDLGPVLNQPEHFDGVDFHPTLAGHEAIAAELGPWLLGLLEVPS